jgi:hypothetical protein
MLRVNLCILVSVVLASCATNKKVTKQVEEDSQVVEIEMAAPVEEIAIVEMEGAHESSSGVNPFAFDPVKSIQFNPKYTITGSINDSYDFYGEKNSPNRYSSQGVVDKNGNVILPHIFSRGSGPNNNYELVLTMTGSNSGLYNLNENRWTIPMLYQELYSLGNSVFGAKKDNKWGLVDNNNLQLAPMQWKMIDRIYNLENYILVSVDDMWGIYSILERKLTVPTEYSSIRKLERENYFLVRKGTKANVVDINNKLLFKRWYDEVRVSSMNMEYFIVKENNKYGVIDHNEKVVVPISYLEFSESNYSDGSYLARNKDGKYGFMLVDGRVTLPFNYDNVKKGYNNNIISIQNGKCGLVRVNSGMPTEIVTCEFDNITEGAKTFIVEKGGKFGLLNQFGKPITEIEYSSLESLRDGYYDDLVIYVGQKGKSVYLLNEQGKVINQDEFLEVSPLYRKSQSSYSSQRFTYLRFKGKNGKLGIVDKVGKVVAQPQFDDIVSEDDNMLVVRTKDKCGLYSLIGQKMIVDFKYNLIIRSNNNYVGFEGKNIDFLQVKSDQVTTMSTMSK